MTLGLKGLSVLKARDSLVSLSRSRETYPEAPPLYNACLFIAIVVNFLYCAVICKFLVMCCNNCENIHLYNAFVMFCNQLQGIQLVL